jgi:hypothetical protein
MANTVKPAYNGNPWDQKKWLLFRGWLLSGWYKILGKFLVGLLGQGIQIGRC